MEGEKKGFAKQALNEITYIILNLSCNSTIV